VKSASSSWESTLSPRRDRNVSRRRRRTSKPRVAQRTLGTQSHHAPTNPNGVPPSGHTGSHGARRDTTPVEPRWGSFRVPRSGPRVRLRRPWAELFHPGGVKCGVREFGTYFEPQWCAMPGAQSVRLDATRVGSHSRHPKSGGVQQAVSIFFATFRHPPRQTSHGLNSIPLIRPSFLLGDSNIRIIRSMAAAEPSMLPSAGLHSQHGV